ncbi:MAG: helix-turn-helix transcriptional regulator [Clostridia bacterium]|nr:helix-turn-helix transcriptional regulator [Clostridia bacterium]
MKTFREIIIDNLVTLRKKNNLTQIDLAKKLNYSDKAVSRWETGEVLPDVEVLKTLSEIYSVPFSYLFEEHEKTKNKEEVKKETSKIITCIVSICAVWTAVLVLYTLLDMFFEKQFWMVFIWAIPISCAVGLFYNKKWLKSKHLNLLLNSIAAWSLIASLYLQFLSYNLWQLFLIGIPIQVVNSLLYFTK